MCNCKCLKAGSRIRIPGLLEDRIFLFQLSNRVVAYCTVDAWNANEYIHPSYSSEWIALETIQKLKDSSFIHP